MSLSTYYSQVFHRFPITTTNLKANLPFYTQQKKYVWIRREHRDFNRILRNPTTGCWVEISYLPFPGSVLINSREGRRLINRICYF
jgi:hypothetical protein